MSYGQRAKRQFGPVRVTVVPSGQILASCEQIVAPVPGSPGGAAPLPIGSSGQGANSQLGPVRETKLPSGHILASWAQTRPPPAGRPTGGGSGWTLGQGRNRHCGPARVTKLPSGHSFASCGQFRSAICCSAGRSSAPAWVGSRKRKQTGNITAATEQNLCLIACLLSAWLQPRSLWPGLHLTIVHSRELTADERVLNEWGLGGGGPGTPEMDGPGAPGAVCPPPHPDC